MFQGKNVNNLNRYSYAIFLYLFLTKFTYFLVFYAKYSKFDLYQDLPDDDSKDFYL